MPSALNRAPQLWVMCLLSKFQILDFLVLRFPVPVHLNYKLPPDTNYTAHLGPRVSVQSALTGSPSLWLATRQAQYSSVMDAQGKGAGPANGGNLQHKP